MPEKRATEPDFDLAAWRRRIPVLERAVPMNACSQGPLTDRVEEAMKSFMDSWRRRSMDWDRWLAEVEEARALFAELIGAEAGAIALTSSVSAAANSVASALDFDGRRDAVAVTEAEFPSVAHVWLARRRDGARVRWIPAGDDGIRPRAYERIVDDGTLIVSSCHAHYETGFTQDLEAVAERVHDAGALLFVDAYQSAGTRPIDVEGTGVDFLASGCQKFLMGTSGIAFLYVAPRLLDRLEPRVTGWFGRRDPFAFDPRTLDWAPDASRFEIGTPPVPSAYVARAGMEVVDEVGTEAIREWTRCLGRRLVEGGRDRGLEPVGPDDPARRNPTVAFRCPERTEAAEVGELLRDRGVIAAPRGRVVRLTPHFYSSRDDVDRALDALAEATAA